MKSMKKILFWAIGIIIVLIISVIVLVQLFGSSILKTGIESAATKTLNVGVSIDDMDLSIFSGQVGFHNLVIDNPPGYQHEKLLEVGDADIAVNIGSLLEDTVNIKEIMMDNVNVVLEQKGVSGNNLEDIIKSLPKKEPGTEEEAKKSKKLHIDTLEIKNITVQAKLLPVPGKVDTVTLKLNPIRMTDLGSDEKLDTAELTGKILVAITTGIAQQGMGVLPDDMTNALKSTLSLTAGLGKAAAESGKKLLEQGGDTGKGILKGVQDLLKQKEDQNSAN
jgi:hypothetical protein